MVRIKLYEDHKGILFFLHFDINDKIFIFIILGLMPANVNNGRPKPFFTYFGFGDIQLELISWFGLYNCLLFVKYESMVFAAILWASYLSIGMYLKSGTFINIALKCIIFGDIVTFLMVRYFFMFQSTCKQHLRSAMDGNG